MMLKLYDWECRTEGCGATQETSVSVPAGKNAPRSIRLYCAWCKRKTMHDRLFPLPAPYMGEKVCSPLVYGGTYDTVGWREPPDLPAPSSNATRDECHAVFDSHEYREASRARKQVLRENKQKQKRLAALKSGRPINFRRDKVGGDPTDF